MKLDRNSICFSVGTAALLAFVPTTTAQDAEPDAVDPQHSAAQLEHVREHRARLLENHQRALANHHRELELAQVNAEALEPMLAQTTELPEPPEPPEPPEVAIEPMDLVFDAVGDALPFGSRTSTPLIVGAVDPESTGLREDLSIMGTILSKAVERDRDDRVLGITVPGFAGTRGAESIYLDNYGALFLLRVRFPLLPPKDKVETKPQKPADTTWEKTKRELYGPREQPGQWRALLGRPERGAEFDAKKVESLKRFIFEALRNAGNIRHLKPDDTIAVAITGPASNTRMESKSEVTVHLRADAGGQSVAAVPAAPRVIKKTAVSNSTVTTLVIKVRKSDAESYAQDRLSLDDFIRKAVVATY